MLHYVHGLFKGFLRVNYIKFLKATGQQGKRMENQKRMELKGGVKEKHGL